MPQPEAPLPQPPETDRRRPTARQVVIALLATTGVAIAAVAASEVFDGGDDGLATEDAAARVQGLVDEADGSGALDRCPFDIESLLEQVSEQMASDVVFDVLDIGAGPRTTVTTGPRPVDGTVACDVRMADESRVAVLAITAHDGAGADDLVSALEDREISVDVDEIGDHRRGSIVTTEWSMTSGSSAGAIWIDSRLAVSLSVFVNDGDLDQDRDALVASLESILPDVVDDLADG